MIVLDEQLLGRELDRDIAKWYRGTIRFVTDLRPNTIIKDEAIAGLLRRQPQPTFVTINERDFWGKVGADRRYCVVCFALPDSRAGEISRSLRVLFGRSEFRTKARRMGKVIRVSESRVSYYTADDWTIRNLP